VGELELTPLVRGVMGLLLLGYRLLVLRLRRLGTALEATRDPSAESAMIVCLMVAYLTPQGSATLGDIDVPLPMLSITAIAAWVTARWLDRKSTRLNSSHVKTSYAVSCLKKTKA